MKINLNNPSDFTYANVAKLIGSVIDTQHWQLRVTTDGFAYLSEKVGNKNLEDVAFRLETWCQGNGYVGFQAQHDDVWVNRVFKVLKNNWPKPTSSFIDIY